MVESQEAAMTRINQLTTALNQSEEKLVQSYLKCTTLEGKVRMLAEDTGLSELNSQIQVMSESCLALRKQLTALQNSLKTTTAQLQDERASVAALQAESARNEALITELKMGSSRLTI
jgi:hypothetical protein